MSVFNENQRKINQFLVELNFLNTLLDHPDDLLNHALNLFELL